jgi:precorrin-6Y C5,15-methyltransferase (decarboxylating)
MSPWITVIGFGEDGLEALSPVARALIDGAEVLVGGERHLAKVPPGDAQRMSWGSGFAATLDEIAKLKGRRVTVLASGDPMDYGAGTALARRFPTSEMTVVPAPGAFSLACARMAWSRPDVETLTVHGRPLEKLLYHVAPGTRLLVLSQDGDTPAGIAALLSANGYGPSPMTVLEHLNGTEEKRLEGIAEDWSHPRCADLNTVAVECRAGPGARLLSRVPGLPDDAFEHDGQITKREVRAATLAALVPLPSQMLWDIGAGSGAVAIEWLRAERSAGAVAIERDPARAVVIARNAAALGVPGLRVVEGVAPAALDGLDGPPDAVFVGGGVAEAGLLEAGWEALPAGGRLVANAVTLEGEARLLDAHGQFGGTLTRIAVARAEPIGGRAAFRPLMTVTQFAVVKG